MKELQYKSVLFLYLVYCLRSVLGAVCITASRLIAVPVTLITLLVFLNYNNVNLSRLGGELWRYVLFVVYAVTTGAFLYTDFSMYSSNAITLVQCALFVFLIDVAVVFKRTTKDILWIFVLTTAASIAYGFLSNNVEFAKHGRLSVLGSSINNMAHQLVLITIIMLCMIIEGRLWAKITALIVIPLSVYVIIFSASRKSLLMLGAGAVLWYVIIVIPRYMSSRSVVKKLMPVFILILVMIFALYLMANFIEGSVMQSRLEEMVDNGIESNLRYQLYIDGINMFLAKPVFGNGLGQYRALSDYDAYSHSDFIEVLANHGIIGFLLYYTVFLSLLIKLFLFQKGKKYFDPYVSEARMLMLVMFAIIVLSAGTVWLYNVIIWSITGATIAFVAQLPKKPTKAKKQPASIQKTHLRGEFSDR